MKFEALLCKLEQAVRYVDETMVTKIVNRYKKDPFMILVACLLSLRTRDTMSYRVATALFDQACTPQAIADMPLETLEKILRPIGTYRVKARVIHRVAREILEKFDGVVPSSEEGLLSLHGVGRKTANLVRSLAFDIPAICVDVHVHRIANRLGVVTTKTPEETEFALQRIVPREKWIALNQLLVRWGQNQCHPGLSRVCKRGCPFMDLCPLAFGRQMNKKK